MKLLIKIVMIVFVCKFIHAQQIPLFNHYFMKPMAYNPAYAGNEDEVNLMLTNRTQWIGFNGKPQYNNLFFDGNFINKNTGIGLNIISDKKGLSSRIGGNLLYSYKLKFNNNSYLRLGIALGAINQSYNLSNPITESSNDPSLFSNSQNSTTFDANTGLLFVWKELDFSFSIPQIANNKLSYKSNTDSRTYYTQVRHYITSLKYNFIVSKQKDIKLSPQILTRYINSAPMQYDVNLNLNLKNKFWIGATYKNNYAISANLGTTLFNKLSIGYSYEIITGSISKYSGLSHEIVLNFKFSKNKKESATAASQENEEDKLLKEMESKDLNKILIQNLLKKIETVLDKENVTPQEIQDLLNEISSFFDDDSSDKAMQETLNKYYKSLKQINGELNVLLKGRITSEFGKVDYSNVNITITDLGSKSIVGTYIPTKEGKYFVILKPGKKYSIYATCVGYQNYTKNFSPPGSIESYEMNQEIQFKK